MRRRLTWLVALPAMLAGSQAAHAVAYRLVFPEARVRFHVLALTGHDYLQWLPLALGVGGAIGLVGFGFAVRDVACGRRVRELSPAAFALLPPLAFALQELLELSLHTGTFAWHAFAEPTFLPGLGLQLPFALLAYAAARLLLRAAVRLGRALGSRPLAVGVPAVTRDDCDLVETRSRSGLDAAPRAPPLAVGI
jgi:hypothetical protein